jgi:hypothetical protein
MLAEAIKQAKWSRIKYRGRSSLQIAIVPLSQRLVIQLLSITRLQPVSHAVNISDLSLNVLAPALKQILGNFSCQEDDHTVS